MSADAAAAADFAVGWLDGAEALQKLTGESLEALNEFSAFVKKLSKLEKQFGLELSQLIAKDGKKLLEREALHGTTHDFVSVFLAQLVDVAKSATLIRQSLAQPHAH
jgi:hypothetical protein